MLSTIPAEILIHIFRNINSAQDVANLSCTCKALHLAVSKLGWKYFLKREFPNIEIPDSDCGNAAHGLIQLSRAWSRRAVLGKQLEPSGFIYDLVKGARVPKWIKPQGQTMGFQAQVDTYEESTGEDWGARKEVIACSAGSQLVIGIKDMGPESQQAWRSSSLKDRELEFDNFRHRNRWFVYKQHATREGRDDILNVNLIKPHQTVNGQTDSITAVIGRANGELLLVSAQPVKVRSLKCYNKVSFNTLHNSIKAAHISPSLSPILAASISDRTVAIYNLESVSANHLASTQFDAIQEKKPIPDNPTNPSVEHIRFLSEEKLAIGASNTAALNVFQLRPDGVAKINLDTIYYDALDESPDYIPDNLHGIYRIASVPGDSLVSGGGQVFLSSKAKVLRLHDLRSRSTYNLHFESSGISSLTCVGMGYIAAGGYSSSIRLIDLRKVKPQDASCSYKHNGWDLFLNLRQNRVGYSRGRGSGNSAIYSLSSPSPRSTKLYAGLEDTVLQMDFINAYDRNPDSIFSKGFQRDSSGKLNSAKTFDPSRDVWSFLMQETHRTSTLSLMKQQPLLASCKNTSRYIDERWQPLTYSRR